MSERAWLVDLDGTLYHARPVKLCMAAELLWSGRSALATLRAFRHEHERLRAELDHPVADPFRLQLERTAERLGRAPEVVERAVREWMIARPGRWIERFARRALLAEIAGAKARGLRLALVSDYPARAKLQALGAEELFEAVVANGEPGGPARLKPWPDGYELAARRLGVPASECLVIGDREDADGLAAERAGMAFRRVR